MTDTLVDLDCNLSGHSTLDNHSINLLHFKLYNYSRTITLLVASEIQPAFSFRFSLFVCFACAKVIKPIESLKVQCIKFG